MLKACPQSRRCARILMWLLPIALLQTPVTSTALSQPRESQAPAKAAPAVKEEMISIAARILQATKSLSQIWPGYWPGDQAFIIHERDLGALLISPGPRPASFEPISETDLPEALAGRAFFHKGSLAEASRPFVIGHPIGDGKTALLANRNPAGAEQTIALILHEQFHGHQMTAFKGREQQFVDPLAVKDRIAFAASADLEQSILAAALSARSERQRRDLLKQYFAVRRERERTIPAGVVKVEQGFERIEGTAQYVDMVGRAAIAGGSEAQLLSLLIERLRRKLSAESGAFTTVWFRGRGYGTGAALTYLISKSGGVTWRSEIESGAKLDEMLERRIGKVPEDRARHLAEAARKQFGYESRLRELAPLISAAEKKEIKSVAEFLALAPYQLVFEPGAAGASAKPGFHAKNMTLLSPSTTALPLAMRFSMTAEAFSLLSQDSPVLLESGKTRRYTIGIKSPPSVEGRGLLPAGEHRLSSLKIAREKLELKVDKPVTVLIEDDRMVIRLDP